MLKTCYKIDLSADRYILNIPENSSGGILLQCSCGSGFRSTSQFVYGINWPCIQNSDANGKIIQENLPVLLSFL
jgi:hypothetical protein